MTFGSLAMSAGLPSAILRPKSMTTTSSEMLMTIDMWCSTNRTDRPNWSRISRMVSASSSTSPWVSPLAGSSSSSSFGCDASARAKRQLVEQGLISDRDAPYVAKVLGAAALTYVAATLQSVMTLAYYLWIATNQRR